MLNFSLFQKIISEKSVILNIQNHLGGEIHMTNCGVLCNVNECMYHKEDNKCSLDKIEVSHEKTSAESISIPHFCKSYKEK